MDTTSAETLADKLAFRDFDRDTRRVCDECSQYQFRNKTCFKRLPTSPEQQLANCHGFEFVKP